MIATAISSGGSKNGTTEIAPIKRCHFGPSAANQFPKGTPSKILKAALTTAITAVVSVSSRLVIKDVGPVL